MMSKIRPIRSEADYEAALAEIKQLWGARSGTPEGDRLDVLATLIDAYEAERYAIDPPDSIEILSRPSNSVEQRNVSHQLETASRYLFAWGAVRDPLRSVTPLRPLGRRNAPHLARPFRDAGDQIVRS